MAKKRNYKDRPPELAPGVVEENHVIGMIEKKLTKEPIDDRVLVAEELDLTFGRKQLYDIQFLINEGHELEGIAAYMKRDPQEILHALIEMFFDGRFKIKKKLVLFND